MNEHIEQQQSQLQQKQQEIQTVNQPTFLFTHSKNDLLS